MHPTEIYMCTLKKFICVISLAFEIVDDAFLYGLENKYAHRSKIDDLI
jgi:hypothetical protein